MPASMLFNVDNCHVARMKGRKLQRIRCARPEDRLPICVSVRHTFEWNRPFQLKKANPEARNASLLYGYRRTEFLQAVESNLDGN
eukprot:7145946-Pyramimonas_sp.AAC.1